MEEGFLSQIQTVLGMINADRVFDYANQVQSECPTALSFEGKTLENMPPLN